MAALELAKAGLDAALIDHRHRIGDKLCTGVIGAECADRFPVPPDLTYHRASSAVIHSPAGRRYTVEHPQTQALIVDRVAYIAGIAREAESRGAELRLGYTVRGVEKSADRVAIRASGAGEDRLFEGRLLIAASGFGHSLTKMAGLEPGNQRDFLMGCQAEVRVSDLDSTQVFLGQDVARSSFGWLVPTSPATALLGTISRSRDQSGLARLASRLRAQGGVTSDLAGVRHWGIPLKPIPKTYGERVMALGDAAGFAKPITGGGIYYAMLSGLLAARTAIDALDAEDFSAGFLSRYESAWKREFGDELRIGYYARMLFESMSDAQIELLMETFLSSEVQEQLINSPDFSFDRHSRTILRTVGHRRIARLIASFGPSVAPFLTRLLKSAVFLR